MGPNALTKAEKNREYQRRYREKYPDRCRDRRNNYRRKYPERNLWYKAKERAKDRGLEFDIEVSDITIPGLCPVFGIPIFLGDGKVCDNSPSLDRINPDKGYVKGNISVISYKANRCKSDLSKEDLINLLKYINSS